MELLVMALICSIGFFAVGSLLMHIILLPWRLGAWLTGSLARQAPERTAYEMCFFNAYEASKGDDADAYLPIPKLRS